MYTIPTKPCMVTGCKNPAHRQGPLCDMHRKRLERTGSLELLHKEPYCEVEDCDSPARARSLCEKHYRKLLKYGDPLGGPGQGKGPRPNRSKRKQAS